ncbi:chromosome partitioning protein [Candidatus Fervidibacteria bacterium JGI MDM2 JNZ-1-D12]
MSKVIAVANQKGGVGKTTTTLNLGAALSELGKNVLLVDADPQGNLGVSLGIKVDDLEKTLYDVLLNPEVTPIDSVIIKTPFGFDLVPSNIDLSGAEIELMDEVGREYILKEALKPVMGIYDYIIIDCPPSLGLLVINALTAADLVIIPVQTEFLAMRGIKHLQKTILKVQRRTNPKLKVRLLSTMFDARTIHARDVLEEIREIFKGQVYKTVIKRTIKFADSSVAGMPILFYESKSEGAKAYRALAEEVIKDEKEG